MALPKRQRRRIVCHHQAFHWFFPQGRDVDHRADYHLIIQAAHGRGQILKVWQESWSKITPGLVAAAIDEGMAAGWNPNLQAPPFRIVRADLRPKVSTK